MSHSELFKLKHRRKNGKEGANYRASTSEVRRYDKLEQATLGYSNYRNDINGDDVYGTGIRGNGSCIDVKRFVVKL